MLPRRRSVKTAGPRERRMLSRLEHRIDRREDRPQSLLCGAQVVGLPQVRPELGRGAQCACDVPPRSGPPGSQALR